MNLSNREIKFRFYCEDSDTLSKAFAIEELANGIYDWHGDIHKIIKNQYTGLKDKNSVEIYEGDIVKADCRSGHNKDNGKYVIEYDRTNCCFYGNPGPVIQLFGLMLDVIHCEPISDLRQNIEVIGNIYENPELLKGEV